jgi:hypothetical protein
MGKWQGGFLLEKYMKLISVVDREVLEMMLDDDNVMDEDITRESDEGDSFWLLPSWMAEIRLAVRAMQKCGDDTFKHTELNESVLAVRQTRGLA